MPYLGVVLSVKSSSYIHSQWDRTEIFITGKLFLVIASPGLIIWHLVRVWSVFCRQKSLALSLFFFEIVCENQAVMVPSMPPIPPKCQSVVETAY